jgi:hypothetical protein
MLTYTLSAPMFAEPIDNAGFEQGLSGWQKLDKTETAVKLSDDAKTGSHSLKIVSKGGSAQQKVTLLPNTQYELSADIKNRRNGKVGQSFSIAVSQLKVSYLRRLVRVRAGSIISL